MNESGLSLHYDCPGSGGWGMARTGSLVPESVELFVCPSACGRHGALSAYHEKWKDRLFYLYLDAHDMIEGYAHLIPGAVEEILEYLSWKPRVFYIFLTCIDDLIGTDRESLIEELTDRFPDIRFCHAHMNPIASEGKLPPIVSIQNNMYRFLDPSEIKDNGINLIGPAQASTDSGELPLFLCAIGADGLRHISNYQSFDKFQEMARSRGNLVTNPVSIPAAREMEKRLGIPWIYLPVTYDLDEVEEDYRRLARCFFPEQEISFPLDIEKEKTQEAISLTLEKLGDYPLVIDSTAVLRPYHLALTLLRYGFRVIRIEEMDYGDMEREQKELLQKKYPEVEIFYPERPETIRMDRKKPDTAAIGMVAGYIAGSRHVADLFSDFYMYGYDGICRLMQKLRNCMDQEADIRSMIDEYGLVI